jgi:hypothetical protein
MADYPRPWSWPGAIALVLASCLGLGWLIGVVAASLGAVGASEPELAVVQALYGIGATLAGALGVYLGFSVAAHRQQPLRAPGAPQRPQEDN